MCSNIQYQLSPRCRRTACAQTKSKNKARHNLVRSTYNNTQLIECSVYSEFFKMGLCLNTTSHVRHKSENRVDASPSVSKAAL